MADNTNLFAHGSRWIRVDFHLHTYRDKEFKDDGGDQDFVARYVAALKQAEIHVGVITNHNKFDREEFKALRKAGKKEDIFLLPGIEISVKDGASGIHMLVVFSNEWIANQEQTDHINGFLGVTFAGQSNYDSNNARSNHDLLETIRELEKFQRDYLLIFAHVEEQNGLFRGLSGGRIKELGQSEIFRQRTAAFQKVRTRDMKDKVQDWLDGWYPTEVEGSDPKTIHDIGRGKKTFVKIGAFTFEAIQFALIPDADRICSADIQTQPHSWVRAIHLQSGILDGTQVDFSREMSCLIGIRGSGKSAVIECLRYALDLPMPQSSDEVDLKYKQDLVRHFLKSGGKVVVEVEDAQGRVFQIRRILNERYDVYYGDELQSGVTIPVKNPLFFGQKELVQRGAGLESELVERLIGSKLDPVRREIATQRQHVLDVLGNLDKLEDLDALEAEYDNKRKDTEFRLKLFRDYGVEEQLKRQVQFNADVTHGSRVAGTVEDFFRSFEAYLNDQEAELASIPRLESSENADLMDEINVLLDRIRKVPEKVRQVLNEARNDSRTLKEHLLEITQRREALKEEFANIERELSKKLQETDGVRVRPDDFVKLNTELQKVKMVLTETAKSRTRRNTLRDELRKELKRLNVLWHEEFKSIEAEVKILNDGQSALQIIPEYKGDRDAMLEELKDHFRGSRLRESTLESALDGHADFISLYEGLDTICNALGDSGEVFRKYFNEAKASLLTWLVPTTYQILYHGKELRDHSLGQRASALILFILNQRDNDLIVIDQPEDDLDNQTIFEDVIKLIRSLKMRIQFIFATHNANFPVLGDTEQVGACSFAAETGDINTGSIDHPEIQKAIVSIMEGGREAFARRKEIYQLWKQ